MKRLGLALALLAALASVPAQAAAPKLSGDLAVGTKVGNWRISPDSRYVVYSLDRTGARDLYSVPISGGAHVVFLTSGGLHSVPIGGPAGDAVKLSDSALDGVNRFALSADGQRVVYRGVKYGTGTQPLYSVPIASPAEAGVLLGTPRRSAASRSRPAVTAWSISPTGSTACPSRDQRPRPLS